MSLINATAIPSGASFELDQSLKFNDNDSPLLQRTFTSGNRQAMSLSFWFKRGNIGSTQIVFCATIPSGGSNNDNNFFALRFESDDKLAVVGYDTAWLRTKQAFRDTSAWYHCLLEVNSTSGSGYNRVKMAINGYYLPSGDITTSYPSQNHNHSFNVSGNFCNVSSRSGWLGDGYFDGYLAEMHYIDGSTAYDQTHFGETGQYGEWKPIEVTAITDYGTNGFYLPFKADYEVEGFNTVTWRGTGARHNYIGGSGFRPNLVWLKNRTTNGANHLLWDTLRSPAMNAGSFRPDSTNGQAQSTDEIEGISADGFTVAQGGDANGSGNSLVAWTWDMGADTPTGFNAIKYRGHNVAGITIGNCGFTPNLTWIKPITVADNWVVYDSVRGYEKQLKINATDAEDTNNRVRQMPDGVLLNTADSNQNSSSHDYMAYHWDMGTSNVSNTTGTITSTVSANTTYGQSIVKYTGTGSNATIGHGLSSAPEMIIFKESNANDNWSVYHTSVGNTGKLRLNGTNATITGSTIFNNTSPTSSVFTTGTDGELNGEMIAYCFHSVTGYSKIASYTGNGSATGPTVTTGFRPAFLLIKKNADEGWIVVDSTRNPVNTATASMSPNNNAISRTDLVDVDFLDTGFQLKGTDGSINSNGSTYFYYAVAGGEDSRSTYNTDGDIDCRVKVNSAMGQSMVKYAGTGTAGDTVGHGLGGVPDALIFKSLTTQSWNCFFPNTSMGATKGLQLDNSGGQNSVAYMNNTMPTSSVFSLGSNQAATNAFADGVGQEYMVYCWKNVTGYSKIGEYTGNGSTTGPVVTCGFEPAFVMIKVADRTDGGNGAWWMYDNARGTDNVLLADSASNELSNNSNLALDFLSNGFQPKSSYDELNVNNGKYIYMAFANKREYAYWLDQSGKNNDFESNNIKESDISVDSPTNNFCVMNPKSSGAAHESGSSISYTLQQGNLESKWTGQASAKSYATMAPTDGKWYWEFYIKTQAESSRSYVGLCEFEDCDINGTGQSGDSNYHIGVGNYSRVQAYGNEFDNVYPIPQQHDVYSIAIDWSASPSKFWFRINGGEWQGGGNPATGTTPTKSYAKTKANASMMPYHGSGSGSATNVSEVIFNFGQDSSFAGYKPSQGKTDSGGIGDFRYEPPSGFLALCTQNLPAVDVKPAEHFNTALFTGDGTSNRDITGTGFNPDLNWLKMRSGADNHVVTDSLRGTNHLHTNDTSADSDISYPALVTDGFRVSGGTYNNNSSTFVAWQWKANGSGSTDNSGDNNATVSANTDAKFSIVKYTGTGGEPKTIAHGLGVKPEMVIIKRTSGTGSWIVWHKDMADNYAFEGLDNANAHADGGSPISKYVDAVSSTLVSVGDAGENNNSGDTYIMYCWASVDGFSKIGSYTGNGNADGPYVYTGFRPAFVLVKVTGLGGEGWQIMDSKRIGYNNGNYHLEANSNGGDDDGVADRVDLLSNGFKVRNTWTRINQDGYTYIYLAFAETPFKYSNAR